MTGSALEGARLIGVYRAQTGTEVNSDSELTDEQLQSIAQEVSDMLKENVNIDWTNRQAMRAKMKMRVKDLLRENSLKRSDYELLIDPIVHQAKSLYGDVSAESHS